MWAVFTSMITLLSHTFAHFTGLCFMRNPKAELLLLKLIQIFARAVLVLKKLEIKETKTT